MTGWRTGCAAAMAAALVLAGARPAGGTLATAGFRAVAVAHAAFPASAMAVAPDGRLFVAVQADGQTVGTTPGTAEIRVYGSYATNDGSVLDRGAVWATVDGVRATTNEEGLLGLALAPDFATTKLIYVYLTTTDESVNQHVRVYHENAGGTGDYLGAVQTTLEPPAESTTRNGGPLAFGVDGCLYAGVGDNGNGSRWNAQLLVGTDAITGGENTSLCTNVCLGTSQYPNRSIMTNGALNDAGKILRLGVSGASPATAAPGAPLAAQPLVFGTGLRNPTGMGVHPLTGQLFVTERGDTLEPEVDVVDLGSDLGWPCLEGDTLPSSGVAACMVGHQASEVYTSHPDWRRPLATHTANPAITGIAAYTGLAYPAEYYGDVFYLLRDSARIYRLDLTPPCFLPHPGGLTPIAFHDTTSDGDFTVNYDFDGNGTFENVSFPVLMAVAQGPDPLGRQVLYVAGKQGNSNALTEDSVIFRIEYATAFTPYAGPFGRVADACFTDGVYSGGSGAAPYAYENPFHRPACQTGVGACLGQPDGATCDAGSACHSAGTCQGGVCTPGANLPDGTSCADAEPCNGLETCIGGVCQPGGGPIALGVHALTVKRSAGGAGGLLTLRAAFKPIVPVAPEAADALTLELSDGGGPFFSGALVHPASDSFWHRRGPVSTYADRSGSVAGLTTVQLRRLHSGAVQMTVRGKPSDLSALDQSATGARLIVGQQCFTADLSTRCALDPRRLRCGR